MLLSASRQRTKPHVSVFRIQNRTNNESALQLEFSGGFNPNRNQPHFVNQCFQLFEERNFRLKSG